MDYQILFNAAAALLFGLGGWIFGRITRALDQLDTDVRAMPLNYVTKADYRSDIGEMKASLIRIENKLDGKADK